MKLFLISACALLAATNGFAQSTLPRSISGTARVVDGDTITLGRQRVRIAAIDACEIDQIGDRGGKPWKCGHAARSFLAKMVDGQHLKCAVVDRDQYSRLVGQCFYQDRDVGLALLRSGMASTMFNYLPPDHGMPLQIYIDAETEAKRGRSGIWSARIEEPGAYRRKQRLNHAED